MKILVTGATGFIGNYVIEELLRSEEHTIIATSGNLQKAQSASWYSRVTYIPLDFSCMASDLDYFRFFGEPDALLHLAWEGLPNYKEPFHLTVNFPRHLSFLKNLINNGLQNITATGTCLEYGMQEGCLKEDMPVFPSNPYAIAKNELRDALQKIQQSHRFNLKWLRLFYMYGKGQNPKSLLSQLDVALANKEPVFNMSGGDQVRDFLPVEKVAAYIVKICLQNKVTGIINCCSGKPVTVKEFVENYLQDKNVSIKLNLGYYPYPDYEPMRFWGDTTKLKTILNNE